MEPTATVSNSPPAYSTAPLPGETKGDPTKATKPTKMPLYFLEDVNGRYRFACVDYCEFGRLDFLDVDDGAYISRRHFALKVEDGELYILDLGSRNGTYINGQDIRGKGWIKLKQGDKIEIAKVIQLEVKKVA